MKLSESQRRFAALTPLLYLYIQDQGYEWTYGDAFRDPRVHGEFGAKGGYGRWTSNHKRRLAVDVNLFKDGKFLRTSEDHRIFGEFWESLDPKCRWGGRFNDGNHYEYIHEGWR